MAFSARGHGFVPRARRGKITVSEHAFLSVICRDDTKSVCRPLDRDVNWRPLYRESHPLCRSKNITVIYMITCRLSCCKNRCVQCTPAHNPGESGCSSLYRKRNRPVNKNFQLSALTGI